MIDVYEVLKSGSLKLNEVERRVLDLTTYQKEAMDKIVNSDKQTIFITWNNW